MSRPDAERALWDDVFRGAVTRRSILRRAAALGLSAPVVAALLAACGGDDDAAPTATSAPAGTSTTGGATATTSSSAGSAGAASPAATQASGTPAGTTSSAQPKSGGTLVVATERDVENLDPAYTSTEGRRLGRAIFDPLVEIDLAGNFRPGLLEKWEQPNDRTYLFSLRPGVKFHDGTPLEADALKLHFERHFDPDVKSLRRSEFGPFEKAEVVDTLTCRITLTEPFAPFLAALFDRAGFVLSPAAWEQYGKEEFGYHPVGTGPFKFVSYTKDVDVQVERNPDYWRGDGQPHLDGIIFRPIPTASTRLTELRSGGVHIAETLPFQDVERLKAMPEIVVSEAPGFRWDAFMFNSRKEIATDKAFRQAFNWAIDREAIQTAVFFNTGSPGYDPFFPNTPYFDPNYKPFQRDIAKARTLIQESGMQTPVKLQCLLYQDDAFQKAAQILQANLAEIGVDMSIEVRDLATVQADFQAGNYDFSVTWFGWRPDPDAAIYPKFHSQGSQNFYGFYSNPRADEILDETRAVSDQTRRVQLYRELADILNEDAVFIFYHYGSDLKGLSPKVKGFDHFSDSMTRYHTISLE